MTAPTTPTPADPARAGHQPTPSALDAAVPPGPRPPQPQPPQPQTPVEEREDAPADTGASRRRGRLWTFVVDKGMPLVTAILTVLAAALGVWGVKATNDKNELADTVVTLEERDSVLSEDNATLTSDLAEARESRDTWKARAEAAEKAQEEADTTASTPATSDDPTDPPSDVAAGEAGIFRQTGTSPVTFAYDYGIDLDTREENWGVGSGGDVNLSKHVDGLSLFIPSRVIAVVDQEPSYADCDAQTVLRDDFDAELTVVGTQFCMRTSEARWAYVEIVGLDPARETITLHLVVWTLVE